MTATPAVAGAWHWFSPTELHWRPVHYWAAGTKVSVAAHINGYDAGNGVWGVKDVTVNYRIGDSHVSTVDVIAHTMTVTDNGAVIKVIPVSTGRDKYPTKSGVHVVSDKAQKMIMDSATVGIPRNSPDGYYETVYWDVRISNSGEFVHAAPWSVGDQGHVNVSHGCVNVSTADAEWFYDYSQVGDVVTVVGLARAARADQRHRRLADPLGPVGQLIARGRSLRARPAGGRRRQGEAPCRSIPSIQVLLDSMAGSDTPELSDMSVPDARAMMAMLTVVDGEPEPVDDVTTGRSPVPAGDIPVRIYRNAGRRRRSRCWSGTTAAAG